MLQNDLTLALIVKKCKELLNGSEVSIDEQMSIEVRYNEQGEGQTMYFIRDLNHVPEPGKRARGAKIIVPPDGKVFAEYNVFKDEAEILTFITN